MPVTRRRAYTQRGTVLSLALATAVVSFGCGTSPSCPDGSTPVAARCVGLDARSADTSTPDASNDTDGGARDASEDAPTDAIEGDAPMDSASDADASACFPCGGATLTATSLQGVGYAPADFLISEQGFPFLKKSPVWLNEEASDATLRIAARLPGPDGAAILDEAQKLRMKKSSLFDKTG